MKDVEILRFSNVEEYQNWLKAQSWAVKQKARAFHKRFGENTVPVVIIMNSDTCMQCWGPDAVVHVFINPLKLEEVLNNVVFDEEEPQQ